MIKRKKMTTEINKKQVIKEIKKFTDRIDKDSSFFSEKERNTFIKLVQKETVKEIISEFENILSDYTFNSKGEYETWNMEELLESLHIRLDELKEKYGVWIEYHNQVSERRQILE